MKHKSSTIIKSARVPPEHGTVTGVQSPPGDLKPDTYLLHGRTFSRMCNNAKKALSIYTTGSLSVCKRCEMRLQDQALSWTRHGGHRSETVHMYTYLSAEAVIEKKVKASVPK